MDVAFYGRVSAAGIDDIDFDGGGVGAVSESAVLGIHFYVGADLGVVEGWGADSDIFEPIIN